MNPYRSLPKKQPPFNKEKSKFSEIMLIFFIFASLSYTIFVFYMETVL